jgi:hypothetical protein
MKKLAPMVEGDRRQHLAITLECYAGTVEFGQESAGITTPSAPPGHQHRPHPPPDQGAPDAVCGGAALHRARIGRQAGFPGRRRRGSRYRRELPVPGRPAAGDRTGGRAHQALTPAAAPDPLEQPVESANAALPGRRNPTTRTNKAMRGAIACRLSRKNTMGDLLCAWERMQRMAACTHLSDDLFRGNRRTGVQRATNPTKTSWAIGWLGSSTSFR